ncbi:MAG: xanthine dehydrogenase [Paracoccus denitrificans]|nr:MAG: xanthine dehydrogenase [Paracoccus denitrificans]PZO85512.1 MAG: xanthine dehydrogenase [Paracoccus denitrificans]
MEILSAHALAVSGLDHDDARPPAEDRGQEPSSPAAASDPTGDPLTALQSGGVMAVITGVEGPHYRRPGAFMAFTPTGGSVGQLSSGCIEGDLAKHAADVMADGRVRRLRYGAGSPFMDLQLPCGGGLDVALLPADPAVIADVLARRADRVATRLGLDLDRGKMAIDCPGMRIDITPATAFSVWGAGVEAVTFAALAHAAGYPTRLHSHDPVTAQSAWRLGVDAAGLAWQGADEWTAVTLFYHDHDREPPILANALRSDAFYVGAQGSLRSHNARLTALRDMGLTDDQLARLRGPIGLIKSARDPKVLAVSVLAEILAEAH